ncbi:MAG: hypothetical protein P8N63_02200, partial [Pseudomonadales bacterium]|nr:hypothetical protein [Pseudomonadales bacterium]
TLEHRSAILEGQEQAQAALKTMAALPKSKNSTPPRLIPSNANDKRSRILLTKVYRGSVPESAH